MGKPKQSSQGPEDVDALARTAGYFFFFFSGATALMYEIIWLRLLGLIFGNTTFAVATVLSAFMAGLGIGGLIIGKMADRARKPLQLYGYLEIGIGLYAACTLLLVAFVQNVYVAAAQHGGDNMTLLTGLRLALSFVIIFIPTLLMGATLPVLGRFYIQDARQIGSETARLYALNIAGAVTGTLLAGFVFLPVLGLRATLFTAVSLNILIGVVATILGRTMHVQAAKTQAEAPTSSPEIKKPYATALLLLGLFVSGATAMIYQVSWTRILGTVLGSSTYAFTLMLATFLLGMTAGSASAKRYLSLREASFTQWGWLQVATAFAALLTLPLYDDLGLAFVRIYAFTVGHLGWLQCMMMGLCSLMMFIPAFCFGAVFPVTVALHTRDTNRIATSMGKLYFSNTCGNIAGSLGAGFALVPLVGIHGTILTAAILSSAIGLTFLLYKQKVTASRMVVYGVTLAALCFSVTINRHGWDPRLVTSGLNIYPQNWVGRSTAEILGEISNHHVVYYKEGLNGIVSVDRRDAEDVLLRVNGKIDASNGQDMRTQLLSAHLPLLLHQEPRKVCIIGFGSGVTLAASLAHPSVSSVDCVEIEKGVIEAAEHFRPVNRGSFESDRANLIVNDGRNHLLATAERYDAIISEPSNPWMAGLAYLFTTEYYELVSSKLAENGIFCQWLQSYSIAPDDYKMVIASVTKVFPHVNLWTGVQADTLIIASHRPIVLDLGAVQNRFNSSKNLRDDLARFEMRGPAGLLSSFMLGATDVRTYVRDAKALNTDDKLLLEFNAPKALFRQSIALISQGITGARTESAPYMKTSGAPIQQDPALLAQLGYGFLGKGDEESLQLATLYFQRSLQLSPDQPDALVGFARCHLMKGKYEMALSSLEHATTIQPDHAEAWAHTARVHQQMGAPANARSAMDRAMALSPDDATYHGWSGEMAFELHQGEAAAAAFTKAHELDPQEIDWPLGIARSMRMAGAYKAAAHFLEQMHQAHPYYGPIMDELREALLADGQYDRIIELYEEALSMNAYDLTACTHLARLYQQMGRSDDLRKVLRHGQRLHPDFEEIVRVSQQLDRRHKTPTARRVITLQEEGQRP